MFILFKTTSKLWKELINEQRWVFILTYNLYLLIQDLDIPSQTDKYYENLY